MRTIYHQLRSYPPVQTVEPKLEHYFNVCSVYGSGEVSKLGAEQDLIYGSLVEDQGRARLGDQGDYYNMLPLGDDPPVPLIHHISINSRGWYSQEFDQSPKPSHARVPSLSAPQSPRSPELFYSSSPEPGSTFFKLLVGLRLTKSVQNMCYIACV